MDTARPPRHPGLQAIFNKLHRGESLSGDELERLRRQISDLETSPHEEHSDGQDKSDIAAPADVLPGHATLEGTSRFADIFGAGSVAFYRRTQGLLLSTMGVGTYRGAANPHTDSTYIAAVHGALRAGVNVIDTSLNYRNQRSERSVAAAIRLFTKENNGERPGILISTKGGFIVSGAITKDTLRSDDVVAGKHSIAPSFLADQLERSRRNLGLETIDVYYVHNPEVQLESIAEPEFIRRISAAFAKLEEAVDENRIRWYGTATWDGYRSGRLSLPNLVKAAHQVAGDDHHFRFIQLPLNLGTSIPMEKPEASTLEVARNLGMTVMSSASLMQGALSADIPEDLTRITPLLRTDAQCAIQFARSVPGVTSALVGMKSLDHVAENTELRSIPPLTSHEYCQFCSTLL